MTPQHQLSLQLSRAATEAMVARRFTIEEVANLSGVPLMTVQSLLTVKANGTMSEWNKIAGVLHLSVFAPPSCPDQDGVTTTPWETVLARLDRIETRLSNGRVVF